MIILYSEYQPLIIRKNPGSEGGIRSSRTNELYLVEHFIKDNLQLEVIKDHPNSLFSFENVLYVVSLAIHTVPGCQSYLI